MDSTDRHRQVFRGLKDSTEVSHMDSHTHVLTKWISHARGNLGTRSLILLKDYVGVKKKKKKLVQADSLIGFMEDCLFHMIKIAPVVHFVCLF